MTHTHTLWTESVDDNGIELIRIQLSGSDTSSPRLGFGLRH